MNTANVWLITGAGRGMGLAIAKSALVAGKHVIATGRNTAKVEQAIGQSSASLLVVKLDITSAADADAAVQAAVDKFGRIDVLVNNAANFNAGYFEELSIEEIESQVATSLFGPMKVTRAVLPVMRKQRLAILSTSPQRLGLSASSSERPMQPPTLAPTAGWNCSRLK